jgi:hypothetical protein
VSPREADREVITRGLYLPSGLPIRPCRRSRRPA